MGGIACPIGSEIEFHLIRIGVLVIIQRNQIMPYRALCGIGVVFTQISVIDINIFAVTGLIDQVPSAAVPTVALSAQIVCRCPFIFTAEVISEMHLLPEIHSAACSRSICRCLNCTVNSIGGNAVPCYNRSYGNIESLFGTVFQNITVSVNPIGTGFYRNMIRTVPDSCRVQLDIIPSITVRPYITGGRTAADYPNRLLHIAILTFSREIERIPNRTVGLRITVSVSPIRKAASVAYTVMVVVTDAYISGPRFTAANGKRRCEVRLGFGVGNTYAVAVVDNGIKGRAL